MNDDAEKLKGFLFFIIDEHKAACRKHQKFCDMLVDKQTDWNRLESIMKSRNDEYAPPYYGENILLEEVAEAFNAYSQGKLEIGDYWDRLHNRWLELAEKFKEQTSNG